MIIIIIIIIMFIYIIIIASVVGCLLVNRDSSVGQLSRRILPHLFIYYVKAALLIATAQTVCLDQGCLRARMGTSNALYSTPLCTHIEVILAWV